MRRAWSGLKIGTKDNPYIFNSEDTVEHQWGDFVIIPTAIAQSEKIFFLKIDGILIEFQTNKKHDQDYPYLFFHRNHEGEIDHLVDWTVGNNFEDCPCKDLGLDHRDNNGEISGLFHP